eukprot:3453219-Prymnesium_polylepis.1
MYGRVLPFFAQATQCTSAEAPSGDVMQGVVPGARGGGISGGDGLEADGRPRRRPTLKERARLSRWRSGSSADALRSSEDRSPSAKARLSRWERCTSTKEEEADGEGAQPGLLSRMSMRAFG